MIVHYMQPHFPSLGAPDGGVDGESVDDGIELDAFGERSLSVWEDLRCGHRARDAVWADYRANLEYVLASVESLLDGIDAERVVLTADHGNAFGERYVHGHPNGVDIPCLREVPWSVTSGRADGSGDLDPVDETGARGVPTTSDAGDAPSDLVEDRLEQLGYRR